MQPVSYLVLIDGLILHLDWKNSTGCPFNTAEVNSKLPFLCTSVFFAVVTVHNIFDLVSFRTGIGRLRFATTRAAVTHRPRTNLGRRPFSIAGPSVWNSLPQSLLKTYLLTSLLVNSYRPSQYMSLCCVCCRLKTCNAPLVYRSYCKRGTTKCVIMIITIMWKQQKCK